MGRQGKVGREAWRAADRRRAFLIYLIGAGMAAGLTLALYFFF